MKESNTPVCYRALRVASAEDQRIWPGGHFYVARWPYLFSLIDEEVLSNQEAAEVSMPGRFFK